jgi:hypothetical protein
MTCKSLFFEPSDAKIAIRVRSTPSLASRSLLPRPFAISVWSYGNSSSTWRQRGHSRLATSTAKLKHGQADGRPGPGILELAARAKIRLAPIDDSVGADEQKTIDLYFRSGPA